MTVTENCDAVEERFTTTNYTKNTKTIQFSSRVWRRARCGKSGYAGLDRLGSARFLDDFPADDEKEDGNQADS
jgi:hypothetical protein